MATVTGLTAERMLEIEAQSIVDGDVVAGDLILQRFDGTPINAGSVTGPTGATGPTGPAGASSVTGDYKMSAQTADHVDAAGGTWYLCDGRASPHADLTALVGSTLPDSRGRSLVMKGTHADVNAIGDNDGIALANRRPKHNTTLTDPQHSHGMEYSNADGSSGRNAFEHFSDNIQAVVVNTVNALTGITANAAGGAGHPQDQPAYIVPGSLFIYLEP